jgi:hypothetical protein
MAETGRVTGDVVQPDGAAEIARPRRLAGTALDMVRSLGLLAVIVAVTLIFVPGLLHPSRSQRVQPASYSDDAAGFRQVTGLTALTPIGLGSGWYANSARLSHKGTTATLYIGWVSPTKKYAALYETNSHSPSFPAPSKGDRSLRRTVGKLAVFITGSASKQELAELADSLRASHG